MLYAYPVEATEDNWLHECLAGILARIHALIAAGQLLPKWPDIVPEHFRHRLRGRTGLRDRLEAYTAAMSALTIADQTRVLQAFTDENRIANLVAGTSDCEAVDELPYEIRAPICDLFNYSFNLLSGLGVRDQLYRLIYNRIKYCVCAFCGLEYFDAPGAPREALDHYLAQSRYPFAATNLRNLVPMGQKCNSKYKLAQDILRKGDGSRRRCFDPYGAVATISVSLLESQPFAGRDGQLPAWTIEFNPDSDEVTTWDDVFRIRDRYQRDILDPSFKTWLTEFSSWCRYAQLRLENTEELLAALQNYADIHETFALNDRSFLKAALFRMLLKHCSEGNERLSELLQDLAY